MPIVLAVNGHKYDVTHFDHPGEGINGMYLRNFKDKTVDKVFEVSHCTDEPQEMLEEARAFGEHEGIKYLGPI